MTATPLCLGAQTYAYQDFTDPKSGKTAALMADGIIGHGPGSTILDLTGPIATAFPTWVKDMTTRYNVLRVQGDSAHRLQGPILKGFTLRVTAPADVRQLFNGIRVAYSDGLLVEDVAIEGVPGIGNGPPWETFGLDLTQCRNFRIRGLTVDGKKLGAALIGTNTCRDGLIDSCQANSSRASHGYAHWQSQRITHVDCLARDNGTSTGPQAGAGFSHEECADIVHVNSQAVGNSLAAFRFRGTKASTGRHALMRCAGDVLRLELKQRAADIDTATSQIGKVINA